MQPRVSQDNVPKNLSNCLRINSFELFLMSVDERAVAGHGWYSRDIRLEIMNELFPRNPWKQHG